MEIEKLKTMSIRAFAVIDTNVLISFLKNPESDTAVSNLGKLIEQGKVVTDEKMRTALIQMGYDPDNYVASDLSFDQKSELLKLMYGEAKSSPEENMNYETVDWSNYDSKYDYSNLPKPMG